MKVINDFYVTVLNKSLIPKQKWEYIVRGKQGD